jgi:hypothetical protein
MAHSAVPRGRRRARPTVLAVVLCLALGACSRAGAPLRSCDGPGTTLTVLASPGDFSEQLHARATAFMAGGPSAGDRAALRRIADATGGTAYQALDPVDIEEVFARAIAGT